MEVPNVLIIGDGVTENEFSGNLDENSFSEARYRQFEVFVEAEPFEYLIQMVTVVQRAKEARA